MSLYCWLQGIQTGNVFPNASTSAANKEVAKKIGTMANKRMKRGSYTQYSDETRAKIKRYANEHGNKAAATKFLHELEKPPLESNVRKMKKIYVQKLKGEPDPDKIMCLTHASWGRPLMLEDYDKEWTNTLRTCTMQEELWTGQFK